MKKVFIGIGLFIAGLLVAWFLLIFPYPSCTKRQIEVMKQELIDGILQREIRLRELYAEANGQEFVQTEKFKHQLQKEKEKFYKYCDNDGSSKYKNKYCEIDREMELFEIDRYTIYTLKYHFDKESKAFFNQITTFWRHKIVYTNPKGDKKIPHDQFWAASDDDSLSLLYPARVVGYSSEYHYFNCADSKKHWLNGIKELELAKGKPMVKKDLLFLKSKSICYKSMVVDSKGRNKRACIRGIETYIQ